MQELVSRQYLLDEYDRQHQGPPGGARKIIEEAPAAQQENIESFKKRLIESLPEDYAMFTKGDIIERIKKQK